MELPRKHGASLTYINFQKKAIDSIACCHCKQNNKCDRFGKILSWHIQPEQYINVPYHYGLPETDLQKPTLQFNQRLPQNDQVPCGFPIFICSTNAGPWLPTP
jgi:hypothetical protein